MGTTREFLVGLVFFGLLLLLFAFTIVLTDVRIGPEPPALDVHFTNIEGLEDGDEVWINGYRSGKVAEVVPDPESNLIRVRVHFDFEPYLYGNASFHVKPASPLGGRILAIDRGETRADRENAEDRELPERLDLGAFHRGEATADVLTEAAQLIRENRESIHSVLANLDLLSEALGTEGPESLRLLRSTLANAEAVAASLRKGEGALGRLLTDPEVDAIVQKIIARVDKVTREIEEGKGVVGALLTDDELRDDVKASAASIRLLTSRVTEGDGTLARLVNDPELYTTAVKILTDVRGITSQLSPEHGLGKLLVQDATWNRLDETLAKLDQTVTKVRDATMAPDNLIGFVLGDEEPVVLIRQSLRNLNQLLEDTRENAPIATFAGFLFAAF